MKYLKLFEQVDEWDDLFGEEAGENLNKGNVIVKIGNNYVDNDPENIDHNKDIPIFFYRKKDRSIIDDASNLLPLVTKLEEYDQEMNYDDDKDTMLYFDYDHNLYAFPLVNPGEVKKYFRKLGFEVE